MQLRIHVPVGDMPDNPACKQCHPDDYRIRECNAQRGWQRLLAKQRAYGAAGSIAAVPALGYDFSMWSGNCPISDIYERVTTLTFSPAQGTACRISAAFVPGTTNCGSAGKPCCLNSTCGAGAVCNSFRDMRPDQLDFRARPSCHGNRPAFAK